MSSVAGANTCGREYTALLTDEQRAAMSNAAPTHLIQAFEGEVNGKKRLVVFVGETHVQDEDAAKAGRDLVDTFKVRAYEKYPGGFAFRSLLSLSYLLEGITSSRTKGSTIAYVKSGSGEGIENHNLEKDYRPTGDEKLAAYGILGMLLGPKLSWIPALGFIRGVQNGSPNEMIGWVCASAACYIASAGASMAWMDTASGVLRPRRDAAMTKRVIDLFAEKDDREVILLAVGRNHFSGIRDGLEKQGFHWVQTSKPSSR